MDMKPVKAATSASTKYFSKHCLSKLYATTREIVAAEVKGAEFLAATTDMWSALHELYGTHHGRRLDAEDPMVADPLPSTRPH